MEKLGRFFSGVKGVFDYNGATLSGAVDVIVVQHPDGSLRASPFFVRFGKFKVFKTRQREVHVSVNGSAVPGLGLYLADNGKVFQDRERGTSEEDLPRLSRQSSAQQDPPERTLMRLATASTEATDDQEFQYSLCAKSPDLAEDPIRAFNSHRISAEELKERGPRVLDSGDLMVMTNARLFQCEEIRDEVERKLFPGSVDRARLSSSAVMPETAERAFMLTSDQLQRFRLNPGPNSIEYSVTTKKGDRSVLGFAFLYESSAKLVISDIDGTITRSNVLGHVLPKFNKDWSQKGVCQLFSSIAAQGYHFVYLTARAIGQSQSTRDYIGSVRQDKYILPVGPIITSPFRLLASFVREVITHRSENFKVEILLSILALFPEDARPLAAGFGNNRNDAAAYSAAGIPDNHIFIVDYGGKVRCAEHETNFLDMCGHLGRYFGSAHESVPPM